MPRHIETAADIRLLVDSFYEKVINDTLIGFIFTDVAKINLKGHLPTMYLFWESTLFQKNTYSGNPMQKHIELNKKVELLPKHFQRWLKLWKETVDEHFQGDKAELAKQRAESISMMMQLKIDQQKK